MVKVMVKNIYQKDYNVQKRKKKKKETMRLTNKVNKQYVTKMDDLSMSRGNVFNMHRITTNVSLKYLPMIMQHFTARDEGFCEGKTKKNS